ncbi:hypothetical protein [Tenacibaculum aestuarii]|uniref:hypothetical protein n=1 Tax=Tenacibaculum aestuarii TaxID=362781 RepID=UPI003892EE6B
MKKGLFVFIALLVILSCKKQKSVHNTKYNELSNPSEKKILPISEYNTDNPEIENIKRPEKSVIRNSEIDTINLFGIWVSDLDSPHADFEISKNSFFIVDYDGDGDMPYTLNKNKLTVFYNDFIQTGIVTAKNKDTLKIKWSNTNNKTIYLRFK